MPPKGKDKAEKDDKPPKISDKEAQKMILEHLEKTNRPCNPTSLSEALKGAIGKGQATKVMNSLADSKKIAVKEFGKQKVYWRLQDDIKVDANEIVKMSSEIASMEGEKSTLADECKRLSSEVATYKEQPSNEEADVLIAQLEKENEELDAKLKKISNNKTPMTPQEKRKIEKVYEDTKTAWKKRKRMCKDIFSQFEESSGKRYKELKEELGMEDDEDHSVNVDKDETNKIKTGK